MKIFALVNQKGGVGKTPMTWELAAGLAARGLRVVLADFDPQATLTAGVLGGGGEDFGIAEALLGERPLRQCLQETETPNVRILAANHGRLSTAEQALLGRGVDGFLGFVTALEGEEDGIDVLICDCPPNLSILTGNVLTAADYVLVPVDSTQARVALSQLKRTIEASKRLNKDLEVLGAILTRFSANQRLSADRQTSVGEDAFFPAVWPVRLSTGFEKAFRSGKPLRKIAASPAERYAVQEVDAIVDAMVAKVPVPA